MTDARTDLVTQIKQLLDPHPLESYNTVPSNTDHPFIFIGNINLTPQVANKTNFQVTGFVEVHLYTGDNSWVGSLSEPYSWLNEMKVRLQPTIGFVLPLEDHHMVWWRLEDDTGFQDISETEKMYSATVTYAFEINQDGDSMDNVVFGSDNVVFGDDNVIKIN